MPKYIVGTAQPISAAPILQDDVDYTPAADWNAELKRAMRLDPRLFNDGAPYFLKDDGTLESASEVRDSIRLYEYARNGRLFAFGPNERQPRQIQVTQDSHVALTEPVGSLPQPEAVAEPQPLGFWKRFFFFFFREDHAQYNAQKALYEKSRQTRQLSESLPGALENSNTYQENFLSGQSLYRYRTGYLKEVYPNCRNITDTIAQLKEISTADDQFSSKRELRKYGNSANFEDALKSPQEYTEAIRSYIHNNRNNPQLLNSGSAKAMDLLCAIGMGKTEYELTGAQTHLLAKEARKALGPDGELSSAEARNAAGMTEEQYANALGMVIVDELIRKGVFAQKTLWEAIVTDIIPENLEDLLAQVHVAELVKANVGKNEETSKEFLQSLGRDVDPATMSSAGVVKQLMEMAKGSEAVQTCANNYRAKNHDAVTDYLGSTQKIRGNAVKLALPKAPAPKAQNLGEKHKEAVKEIGGGQKQNDAPKFEIK